MSIYENIDDFDSLLDCVAVTTTIEMSFEAFCNITGSDILTLPKTELLSEMRKLEFRTGFAQTGFINEILLHLRCDLEFSNYIRCKDIDYTNKRVLFIYER